MAICCPQEDTAFKDESPRVLVSALQDSAPLANGLQKIQIIKGWMDAEGKMHQRVIDVAGDKGPPSASVNTETCETIGDGHAELCAVWRDPDFDSQQAAVYYARVVENPSCRWSTYDCNTFTNSELPALCQDPDFEKVIQERAWTSPIWYGPS